MICTECNSEYDESKVNIPSPIPDGMCANCGTELHPDVIEELISKVDK